MSAPETDTGWSFEFQHLILAGYLRGDLFKKAPLDPELFRPPNGGGVAPTQEIAEILVTFYENNNRPPERPEFEQLVREAGAGCPERESALQDSVAVIMTTPLPEESFLADRVRKELEIRRLTCQAHCRRSSRRFARVERSEAESCYSFSSTRRLMARRVARSGHSGSGAT